MHSSEDTPRNGSGRVADYFVVVGANSSELRPMSIDDPLNANDPIKQCRPLEMVFEADIVSRYPLVDRENAPSFPDGLTLFCLPDGLRVSNKSKPPSFFSFVQTSDKGSRLVGSCLTFYEKLNSIQRTHFLALCHDSPETMDLHPNIDDMRLYIPRCLCLISQWPFVESFRKFLCHIYRLSLTPSSIPIERFICNFIDDVPVPPSGKVEVSYLVPGGGKGEDSSFIFKRPPVNQPNAWNSLPMKSLFECLSVRNILATFSAVLTERTVVFISSQNHLMASAAETITSLMYPLQWSHVYIPILPRCLLGVLSAPVPLILGLNSAFLPPESTPKPPNLSGRSCTTSSEKSAASYSTNSTITSTTCGYESGSSATLTDKETSEFGAPDTHSSFLDQPNSTPRASEFVDDRYYAVFSPETVRVYLDEDRIEFGSLGPPPPLPERRRRKLHTDMMTMAGTKFFDERPGDWKDSVRPYYDSAYKMALRPDMVDGSDDQCDGEIDEKAIRGSFLKFFVSILQRYRRFLVYPTKANPFPKKRFLESDFLTSSEGDWRDFLQPVISSQAFHQFVNVRLSRSGWTDPEIIFFDESIDAKANRYLFRLHKLDTPFLSNVDNRHTKTYVAPTVDVPEEVDVSDEGAVKKKGRHSYVYSDGFPELQAHLYVAGSGSCSGEIVGSSTSIVNGNENQNNLKLFGVSGGSSQRLKRVSTLRFFPFSRKSDGESGSEGGSSGSGSNNGGISSGNGQHPEGDDGKGGGYSSACVFSTFLTLWGSFVSTGLSESKVNRAPPTLSQVLGRHLKISVTKNNKTSNTDGGRECESGVDNGSDVKALEGEDDEKGDFSLLSARIPKPIPGNHGSDITDVSDSYSGGFVHFSDDLRDEYLTITRSAIKIAFELFNVMETREFLIDANVYRTLADACAVCGAGDRAIDLLRAMLAHKMLPDRAICASIASAISFSIGGNGEEQDTAIEGGQDFLVINPKDVYDAAVNNNVKSLVRLMQSSRSDEDRESDFEDMLLVKSGDNQHSNKKNRFSLFSSRSGGVNDNNHSGITSHRGSGSCRESFSDVMLSTVGAASPRFRSQMLLAERTLEYLFPSLVIDLSNPLGTSCPNFKCNMALSLSELMENFKAFDPNAYTVTCPYCSRNFVPRFTVHSSREDWRGSDLADTSENGKGSVLWCELLSPWVLQKEIMAIIQEHGIQKISSQEFKTGSLNPQYAVLFWNLIVSFRLYGLPYAFLICEKPSLAFLIPLD